MEKKRKWRPTFTLAHLAKLPQEYQDEGAKIRVVYEGFEKMACALLRLMGNELTVPYSVFLRSELFDLIADTHQKIEQIGDNKDKQKERWFEKSFHLVLGSIVQGHMKMDEAHMFLTQGKTAEYAGFLSEAGVHFGRLTMVSDLYDEGVYDRIGSIQSALTGAALGGSKSGATRRKQSRVPTPEDLRIARQKLVDAGKPHREISAMLAKKYDCTTDHIRKILKRD